MPCSCRSTGTDARKIPVMPPSVNVDTKPRSKEQRRIKPQLAFEERRHPAEYLDPGRHGNDHGGHHEVGLEPGLDAAGEHVVGPHEEGEKADAALE